MYLLDASALINAHRTWYALNRVPEFWLWVLHHADAGHLKMPTEIYNEVEDGNDELAVWMSEPAHRAALRLGEASDPSKVQAVLARYGTGLTEAELIEIGQDPFLIAAALGHADRLVVTAEVSKPGKQRASRRIPDICADCGIGWRTPVALINELDFTTGWDQ
ncbi:DUF4411 family protein [Aureimonas phyllosphaerae]|uniref:PIN domain-containing protein n=1 Tax=Aureimonas phyllosphaerae TaxID=1166078 RepID=A0A7W6BR75_9HYPH|nr:DUF4411 family protein [Aureimonas phyllosphaerae]MBB3936578.1 hypothetical protein [Aureimonas phyllosphaerae]MBB3960558.1 hypothetical protein [Aureimonas phyllosphaerae]SFF24581.1 protein of unknown function [Aureimonas phyllosphaerae]